jgi:hypothetical protein
MPGMMGTNMNGMQNMMTTQGQTVSEQQAIQMMHNTPSYAKVISHNNTIILAVRIPMLLLLQWGKIELSI